MSVLKAIVGRISGEIFFQIHIFFSKSRSINPSFPVGGNASLRQHFYIVPHEAPGTETAKDGMTRSGETANARARVKRARARWRGV